MFHNQLFAATCEKSAVNHQKADLDEEHHFYVNTAVNAVALEGVQKEFGPVRD